MEISPIEIRKASFKKKISGFDPEEVRAFLEIIADEFQELLNENEKLKEKNKDLEEKIAHYMDLEDSLNKALTLAQKSAEQILKNSEEKASVIIREAEQKAKKILADLELQKSKLNEEIRALKRRKWEILQSIRGGLEYYLRLITKEVREIERAREIEHGSLFDNTKNKKET